MGQSQSSVKANNKIGSSVHPWWWWLNRKGVSNGWSRLQYGGRKRCHVEGSNQTWLASGATTWMLGAHVRSRLQTMSHPPQINYMKFWLMLTASRHHSPHLTHHMVLGLGCPLLHIKGIFGPSVNYLKYMCV